MPRTEEQYKEIRDQRKEEILSAAIILFAKKGFASTSIAEISKEAGISKGLVYNYFESKDALKNEIVERSLKTSESILPDRDEYPDAAEALKAILVDGFKMLLYQKELITFIFFLYAQGELKEGQIKRMRSLEKRGNRVLEQIMKELGSDDPKQDTQLLGALTDGLSFKVVQENYKFDIEKTSDRIIKLFKQNKRN